MTLIKSISGIRGTIGGVPGHNLTPLDVVKFSSGYGQWIKESSLGNTIVIGRDARISGDVVSELVSSTLRSMGFHVLNVGLSTTPTVELAVVRHQAAGGIILTASHNPKEWNALKLLNQKGEFVSAEDGKKILDLANDNSLTFVEVDQLGSYKSIPGEIDSHIDDILQMDLVNSELIQKRKFKIAIDCVNSTGGLAIPLLLKRLGVEEVFELYTEPNGHFPHNPEPLAEHLTEISTVIKEGSYDLGIVVDPDVDRLALINEDGSMFGEEYTLVAVADYILKHKKGPAVSNLSSSRALRDICHQHGVEYHASAVGEVNVVEKMKEVSAVIGGEGNGGIIYPPLHFGRDALAGIALFLSHLAVEKSTMTTLRHALPSYYMSKNKIQLSQNIDVDHLLDEVHELYSNEEVTTADGVKIDFESGWVHLRKSNTEPIIRVYSEGKSLEEAQSLAGKVMDEINRIL